MNSASLFIASLLAFTLTSSAQTPYYTVYAVRFAHLQNRLPLSYWVYKGSDKDSVQIDFMIWLIKGDNGRTILLDAGFLRGIDDQKEFEPFTYIRPDSALQKLNVQPTDITDIILSHPHWDHADGANLFPNAQVWMQKEDYEYFVGAAGTSERQRRMRTRRSVAKQLRQSSAASPAASQNATCACYST